MKKTILSISFIALTACLTMFATSCSKDDTAPVITIIGDDPATVSLNGTYVDEGATAQDDNDGTVAATVIANDVDEDLAGSYTVTYSATDKEGNEATANRTVNVVNDAEDLAGTYNVHDSCGVGSVFNYTQTVTTSPTVNGRILFNKFGNYTGNTDIYASVTGSSITLPSQTANDIGTASEDHTFSGTGAVSGSNFGLVYTDHNLTNSNTATCIATFIKQ
jgi:hypothetical protein